MISGMIGKMPVPRLESGGHRLRRTPAGARTVQPKGLDQASTPLTTLALLPALPPTLLTDLLTDLTDTLLTDLLMGLHLPSLG